MGDVCPWRRMGQRPSMDVPPLRGHVLRLGLCRGASGWLSDCKSAPQQSRSSLCRVTNTTHRNFILSTQWPDAGMREQVDDVAHALAWWSERQAACPEVVLCGHSSGTLTRGRLHHSRRATQHRTPAPPSLYRCAPLHSGRTSLGQQHYTTDAETTDHSSMRVPERTF